VPGVAASSSARCPGISRITPGEALAAAVGRIVGLSKLARVVQEYAARPQVQERPADQVIAAITKNLDTRGAACVLRATHSCMTLRGAKAVGAVMVTSHLTGHSATTPPPARN
jgi:GTP cyclohydrolase IA